MAERAWIGMLGLGMLLVGAVPVVGQEGEQARPKAWTEWGAPRGTWTEHQLPASGERVRVYTPAGQPTGRAERYSLVIAFDARLGSELPTAAIVDVLVAEQRIASPLIVVMDAVPDDRRVQEVVRWSVDKLRADSGAAHVIIAGAGERGVSAAKLALRHPDLIGNVLLLSNGESQELIRELTSLPKQRVRFAIAVDQDRSSDLHDVRAALEARGYIFHAAAHEPTADGVASGLAFLLSPRLAALR